MMPPSPTDLERILTDCKKRLLDLEAKIDAAEMRDMNSLPYGSQHLIQTYVTKIDEDINWLNDYTTYDPG